MHTLPNLASSLAIGGRLEKAASACILQFLKLLCP